MGNALFGVGSIAELTGAYEESLHHAIESGDRAAAGRAEVRLVFPSFTAGDDEAAQEHAKRALDYLEPLGDSAELADALHALGWFHWRRGRLEAAEGPLRRAEDIARRAGARGVLGTTVSTLGILLVQTGRGDEGLALLEEGFQIAKEIGDLQLLLRNYNNLPSTLHDAAPDPARGVALLREGLDLARKAGVRDSQAWILGTLAEHTFEEGDLEEAERLEREALEIARALGNPTVAGMRSGALAWVLAVRGQLDEAETLFGTSDEWEAQNPEPQVRVPLYVIGAVLARARGDAEGERALLMEGAAYTGDQEQNTLESLLTDLVRALVRLGRRDEARAYVQRLARSAAARPVALPFEVAARGLVAEDPEEAVRLLDQAAAEFERLGRRVDLARCLLDLAGVEPAAGRDPRPTIERAIRLLRECDAVLYLREAEEALASTSG
jgi:tetratricopeptide (TPR) repeat protein